VFPIDAFHATLVNVTKNLRELVAKVLAESDEIEA
jgi:hypothetical protein